MNKYRNKQVLVDGKKKQKNFLPLEICQFF